MSTIDWSKVGRRIRHQPKDAFGKNPDWNWVRRRWKDEADYYADELTDAEVVAIAICPTCDAQTTVPCTGFNDGPILHEPRRREAGERKVAIDGPRFS